MRFPKLGLRSRRTPIIIAVAGLLLTGVGGTAATSSHLFGLACACSPAYIPPTPGPTPTPVPTPTPTGTATPTPTPVPIWVPPTGNVPWMWELDHALSTSSASDLGTGVLTYTGAAAPNPVVYDIDRAITPSSTVTALHAAPYNAHVICYMEIGADETRLPDYNSVPSAALGRTVSGFSDERWIDIRAGQSYSSTVLAVYESRIADCKARGFDAIEPDLDDSYTGDGGYSDNRLSTTWPNATMAQEETWVETLSSYARNTVGIGWGLKNGINGDSFITDLLNGGYVQWAINEQCNQYSECSGISPAFHNAGKAVFQVEYADQGATTASFCPGDNTKDFNGVEFSSSGSLNGGRAPCR